jgi:hypothetical protein
MSETRPFWIWSITAFFLAASVLISLAFILALGGRIDLTAAQQAYLDGLTPLDYLIIGAVMACNLVGAVFLVMLRGFAVPLLVVGWAFGFFQLLWHAVGKGWLSAIGAPGVASFAAANFLSLVIIAYALGLARRGVLH